ncbi:MAG TPA: CoA transferase, partial [Comamonas sp.]
NRQFEAFCRSVIDRADIFEDPRYATNVERARNRLEILPLLKSIIASFPRKVLLERMHAVGIPCGEVAGLHEALTSERTQQTGVFQQMPHPVVGKTWVFAPPYRMDGQRLPIRHTPPTLGSATREVLQELLSMSDAQLQALKDKGVLTLPDSANPQ